MKLIQKLRVGSYVPFDISRPNSIYTQNVSVWKKCRDAYGGAENIKARGTTYLPALNGQETADYNKYLNRAQWYGATERTVQAYLGMLFKKDPVFEYFNKEREIQDDTETINEGRDFFSLVTFDGKSIEDFLRMIVEEVLIVNKVGILVDFPDYNGIDIETLNQYEYEQLEDEGLKPLLSVYKAENIINWYWEIINNVIVPRFFVLSETAYTFDAVDTIVPTEVTNYRILYLEEINGQFVYKQYIINETSIDDAPSEMVYNNKAYIVKDIVTPLKDGTPLSFIPFYVMTDKGLDYRDHSYPMINALVNANIGHYRNSADWENELHWVGIKTLYLPGWNKETNGEPVLGGAMAGPANSKPEMIEASSDSGIEEEMHNKEERMAVLGAERISQQGRYIPSAETARINAESENSTLTNMSKSLSTSLSKVFTLQLSWAGRDFGTRITLNTDFFNENIKGDEVLQWIQAAQQGGISFDTYFYNMQRKEAFPEGWTKEQEIDALQEGYPGMYALSDLTTEEMKAKALAEDIPIVTKNPIEGKTVPLEEQISNNE